MKKIFINILGGAISLGTVSYFMDNSMKFDSLSSIVLVSIILSLLNITIKPLMKLLAFPINIATLGLFSFVINGLVLKLAFHFIEGATLTGFTSAVLAAILVSILNYIVVKILD